MTNGSPINLDELVERLDHEDGTACHSLFYDARNAITRLREAGDAFIDAHTSRSPDGLIVSCSSPSLVDWERFLSAWQAAGGQHG